MRAALLAALLCMAAAAAPVHVAGTLRAADGTPASGFVLLSWSTFTAGAVIYPGKTIRIQIDTGHFDATLQPGAYVLAWGNIANPETRTLTVPPSPAAVALADCLTIPPPGQPPAPAGSPIPLSALAPSGAAAHQVATWNGTQWAPATPVPLALTAPIDYTAARPAPGLYAGAETNDPGAAYATLTCSAQGCYNYWEFSADGAVASIYQDANYFQISAAPHADLQLSADDDAQTPRAGIHIQPGAITLQDQKPSGGATHVTVAAAAGQPASATLLTIEGNLQAPTVNGAAFPPTSTYTLTIDAASYDDGMITATNGSSTINGSGTNWTADLSGRWLFTLPCREVYQFTRSTATAAHLDRPYNCPTQEGRYSLTQSTVITAAQHGFGMSPLRVSCTSAYYADPASGGSVASNLTPAQVRTDAVNGMELLWRLETHGTCTLSK